MSPKKIKPKKQRFDQIQIELHDHLVNMVFKLGGEEVAKSTLYAITGDLLLLHARGTIPAYQRHC